jgi:hypothetical protein
VGRCRGGQVQIELGCLHLLHSCPYPGILLWPCGVACVAFLLLLLHRPVVTRPWRILQVKAQGLLRQARKARTRHQLGITK